MRAWLQRSWKRRRLRLAAIGLVFFGVFNAAALHFTSQNWFCNSCHIMNTYHDSWRTSTHKDTNCVDCHIAPGKVSFLYAKINGLVQVLDVCLDRTGNKPSASVSDFACTREGCHVTSDVRANLRPVTGGGVATRPAEKIKYLFNHDKHLDLQYSGVGVHCSTCHSHIKGKEHFQVNTNACVTCHLVGTPPASTGLRLAADYPASAPTTGPATALATVPASAPATGPATPLASAPPSKPTSAPATAPGEKIPTRECRKCHTPPEKPITYNSLQVVHSEYLAYGAACESCHRGVTARPHKVGDPDCYACHDFGTEKVTSTEEVHRQHSAGKHKVECFNCHGVTRHGPDAQVMQLAEMDCAACHQQQHVVQQTTYKNPQAHQPTKDVVTPMYLAHVDCSGCHVKLSPLKQKPDSGATVSTASPEACNQCHKAGLGDQMIPMWQKNTRQLYQDVEALAKGLPANLPPAEAAKAAQGRRLLELIRLDNSWGVHNPRYTQELLEQARKLLNEAAGRVPTSQPTTTTAPKEP